MTIICKFPLVFYFKRISSHYFRARLSGFKMEAAEEVVHQLEAVNSGIKSSIKELEKELKDLERAAFEKPIIERLTKENRELEELIEQQSNLLTGLEQRNKPIKSFTPSKPENEPVQKTNENKSETVKTKKEAKVKKVQQESKKGNEEPEAPVDVGRLDLKVGQIVKVDKHPDADSLYVEQIDIGKSAPITVVSGLVKFVPIEEMEKKMVVILGNLKPAKMRGVTSEAMVMCASTPEKVEVLCPPSGSQPGDIVLVPGYAHNPDPVLNPKKKIFETVAPDLKTDSECIATYKGAKWTVEGKGHVTAKTLANVNIK